MCHGMPDGNDGLWALDKSDGASDCGDGAQKNETAISVLLLISKLGVESLEEMQLKALKAALCDSPPPRGHAL